MSLFSELKRRNVFRVGIAYVVAAWLLLQVTDVLVSLLGLPEFAGRLMFMLVVVCFIPVLAFAWAYEVTAEGIKRESEVKRSESITRETAARLNRITIGLLIAVAAMVLVDRFLPRQEESGIPGEASVESVAASAESIPASNEPAEETVPSVAVLPFVNMSPDPDNEYFSDGISEELLNLLVRIDGLRVPSRTSSFAFKGQNTDIRDIARQLDVGHVLEGSVRKAGNRVRITAQLIDVASDTHLWSDTYDRELEDIFAIQDEIAAHIVEALKLVLAPQAAARAPTENLEAYNLYLQGRYLFQQRGPGLADAERLLLRAVDLDPGFAEAWAMLALTYVVQPNYLGIDYRTVQAKAEETANRALSLDPGLAEPALAIAQVTASRQQWGRSLDILSQAVEAHPRHALARLWYGITLLEVGYVSQALRQFEKSVELDPVNPVALDWLARARVMTGHSRDFLEPASRAVELGRRAGAMAVLQYVLSTEDTEVLDSSAGEAIRSRAPGELFAIILDLSQGRTSLEEALALGRALEAEGDLRRSKLANHACNYVARQPEATYQAMLEIREFDDTIITFTWFPYAKWFRQHPLMQELAQVTGWLELWRDRGWPDLCHPDGTGGFECD